MHGADSKPRIADQPARSGSLIFTAVRQREVEPAAELVFGVGGALAVPQQHQDAGHTSDSPRSSAEICSTRCWCRPPLNAVASHTVRMRSARSGATTLAPMTRTLASLCARAISAVKTQWQSAARTP